MIESGRDRGDPLEDPSDGVQLGGPADRDLDDVEPDARLQLAERARGDGPTVVDDHHMVGERVGLVQVVGGQQDVGPAFDKGPDRIPYLSSTVGSRPVVGSSSSSSRGAPTRLAPRSNLRRWPPE